MLSDRLRPVLEPITSGAGRALARARITPNALTTIGVLAVIGCAGIIASERPALGGWILIPAVLLDLFDGALARASNQVTPWGGFYDSVCDRVADGALLSAIVWLGYQTDDGPMVVVALVAMITSFAVPYARAKAESMGLKPASGPGERAERYVLIIAGLVFDLVVPMLWILVALTAFTALRRSLAVRKAVR
jgi:CDP-diacylglycerol---glycerol-3-phosphate 3-phosphatidyltransferase